jgi:DNA-binding MarR family transcriptional regulator
MKKQEEKKYGLKTELEDHGHRHFMNRGAEEIMEEGKWNIVNQNGEMIERRAYARSPIKVIALKKLTLLQLFFLSILRHNESKNNKWVDIRQDKICELYSLKPSTVKSIVRRLKNDGYIQVAAYSNNQKTYNKYKILKKSLASPNSKEFTLPNSSAFMLKKTLTAEEKGFFLAIHEHLYQRVNTHGDEEYRIGYSNGKLSKLTGLSKKTIAKYKKLLQDKGYIEALEEGNGLIMNYWKFQRMSEVEASEQLQIQKLIIEDKK